MTAEELIAGLRERGCVILRSQAPGEWVIVPRLKADDPLAEWLGAKGAKLRSFQPEKWTAPEKREYEAIVSTVEVIVPVATGEDMHMVAARRRLDIWEAAA